MTEGVIYLSKSTEASYRFLKVLRSGKIRHNNLSNCSDGVYSGFKEKLDLNGYKFFINTSGFDIFNNRKAFNY